MNYLLLNYESNCDGFAHLSSMFRPYLMIYQIMLYFNSPKIYMSFLLMNEVLTQFIEQHV